MWKGVLRNCIIEKILSIMKEKKVDLNELMLTQKVDLKFLIGFLFPLITNTVFY